MEYIIVSDDSRTELANRVNKWIKEGWLPQGGVSFTVYGGYKETWAQAMVKE